MQRPQWIFRHGLPAYRYRWHAKAWHVDLQYNTLDVADEDVDNFFKITGQPLEEPTFRELVSAAEYRRIRGVEAIKAKRIASIAAHVEEYLKIKAWRTRLRHAVSDLQWNFEPYRKQYEALKKERELVLLEQKRAEETAATAEAKRLAHEHYLAVEAARAAAAAELRRGAIDHKFIESTRRLEQNYVQQKAAQQTKEILAAGISEPAELSAWRQECARAYTSYLHRNDPGVGGKARGPFGIKVEDGAMPYIVYGTHDCKFVGRAPPASGAAIGAVFLHAFEFIRCLHCGYARRLSEDELRKRRLHHQQGKT